MRVSNVSVCLLMLVATIPVHFQSILAQEKLSTKESPLPALPVTLTSFGAAEAGGKLFVCGGHTGSAHAYSAEEQSSQIYVLDLASPKEWKAFPGGPNAQGLGLVPYQGTVIRVGGLTAKNAKGEDQILDSLALVSQFDPKSGTWKELPPLQAARSSHDATIAGSTIYAIGGWNMKSKEETKWHTTMESLDLSADKPSWKSEEVPFQRRALATVAHRDHLYAIGGMEPEGGPSTAVNVYDLKSKTWADGPRLPGKPIDGFGVSAIEVNGKLVATTVAGTILVLDDEKNTWVEVGTALTKRFFHRLVAADNTVYVLGGGNMESGKFVAVETLELHGK